MVLGLNRSVAQSFSHHTAFTSYIFCLTFNVPLGLNRMLFFELTWWTLIFSETDASGSAILGRKVLENVPGVSKMAAKR